MSKDWTGNKRSTFSTLGASSHSDYERAERDFYATDPKAVDSLFEHETFSDSIWENACGNGHLSKRILELYPEKKVWSSDIIKREFECEEIDFLKYDKKDLEVDIVTNPPYKYAIEFVEKSLEVIGGGYKVAMFLKITFLEGQKRRKFFDKFPPKKVCVFSSRVQVARNGDPEMFKKSSAACYAWFIWEKGWTEKPMIEWI